MGAVLSTRHRTTKHLSDPDKLWHFTAFRAEGEKKSFWAAQSANQYHLLYNKMGKLLQKKKNRSGLSKARAKNSRLKSGNKKINVLGNAIIAENWYAGI